MTPTPQRRRNLFRCSRCGDHHKLPWRTDVQSWCPACQGFVWHSLVAAQVDPRDVAERMQAFAQRMADGGRAAPAALPKPLTAEQISHALRSAGWSSRAIEGIAKMRGQGFALSEKIAKSDKRDAQWILFGGNGTGKTTAAARVAALRVQEGRKPGRYVHVPEFREKLGSAMTLKQDQAELTSPLKTCSLLVLDEAQDLGDKSDWLPGILRAIADARYREFRPTIWLLNAESQEAMTARLGAHIVDRANETGGVIHCNWPSYRA